MEKKNPWLVMACFKMNFIQSLGDWNAKVESQETPWVTGTFGLGVQNEAEQRLIEFCQENALVIENTLFQQHKRRLYTWTKIRLIIFFVAKDGETLYSQQKQDWELARFRLKLKKVGKTSRPFKYDLNQVSSDYEINSMD